VKFSPVLTPEQTKDIQRRYKAGEGPGTLAREFGVTRATIYNHTVGKGITRQKAPMVQLTVDLPQEDAQALLEYAAERGVSRGQVVRLALRGLLAMRRR
jgi:hypothetical protein